MTRRPAVLLLWGVLLTAFLASCATSPSLATNEVIEGGENQPIDVMMAGADFRGLSTLSADDRVPLNFNVLNMLHEELTVHRISVSQIGGYDLAQMSPGGSRFDRMVPPGKDEYFEIPVSVKLLPPRPYVANPSTAIQIRVVVTLSTGEGFSYRFEVPVR
jgi:hypothetical protein